MTQSIADQPEPRHFAVGQRDGKTVVSLDGEEIQDHITAYSVDHRAPDPHATVVLELAGSSSTPLLDTLAHVAVAETDPGPAAAAFLSAIDADLLEQAALNRDDLPTGTLTAAMLRQLIDWANGRA